MKKSLKFETLLPYMLILAICLLFNLAGHAQNAKLDSKGNFVAIGTGNSAPAKPSGKTYTDTKGQVFPVMITEKGKYFVERTSKKTGNKYRQYLKV